MLDKEQRGVGEWAWKLLLLLVLAREGSGYGVLDDMKVDMGPDQGRIDKVDAEHVFVSVNDFH